MSGGENQTPRPRIALPASGLASEVLEAARAQGASEVDPILRFADELAAQHPPTAASAPDPETTYVVFELSGEMYGVDVNHVLEALRVPSIVRVPAAPPHVRGITHVRGRILPVIEIRTRITLQALELSERSRLLVVSVCGRTIGLLVDALHDVISLAKSRIDAPPIELADVSTSYVSGIARTADHLLLLMDLERAIRLPTLLSEASP